MDIPLFYIEPGHAGSGSVELPEEISRHLAAVLRMEEGESLQLTDGIGNIFDARVETAHKKRSRVFVTGSTHLERPVRNLVMGVSLLKNTSRFEWFLEKATEIGITHIYPLICSRTEKHQFRGDRMKTILVSAMMQSKQAYLPLLSEPIKYSSLFSQPILQEIPLRLIAHCGEGTRYELPDILYGNSGSVMILIGPEGDFDPAEISQAEASGFRSVALGQTRLRTETAALVSATLMAMIRGNEKQ